MLPNSARERDFQSLTHLDALVRNADRCGYRYLVVGEHLARDLDMLITLAALLPSLGRRRIGHRQAAALVGQRLPGALLQCPPRPGKSAAHLHRGRGLAGVA
jgi:hypothetical protein